MKTDKWQGTDFESSSMETNQFKAFIQDFKCDLRKVAKALGCKLTISAGHFYASGFLSRGAKHVYFSISDVRHFPGEWHKNILVRTAAHTKDYTGGSNNYTSLEDMAKEVEYLLGQSADF